MLRKSINGYDGKYEIDDLGNVYSCKTNEQMSPHLKNGYLAIRLFKDGQYSPKYIHRLVAETFIPNPNQFSEVNHIDLNKTNNTVSNLEWCDRSYNLQHSYDNGRKRFGENHGGHKLTESEVLQIKREFRHNGKNTNCRELSKKYNVAYCTIWAIANGRLWRHLDCEVMPK